MVLWRETSPFIFYCKKCHWIKIILQREKACLLMQANGYLPLTMVLIRHKGTTDLHFLIESKTEEATFVEHSKRQGVKTCQWFCNRNCIFKKQVSLGINPYSGKVLSYYHSFDQNNIHPFIFGLVCFFFSLCIIPLCGCAFAQKYF